MSTKDIYIPMFRSNLLMLIDIDESNRKKIEKSIDYHDHVRQCWIDYKKNSLIDEPKTIDIQYESINFYIDSICQQFKSEIRTLSFQFLNDIINWFHSNKISFIIHDFNEYEINSISFDQLDILNLFITKKYGSNFKFIPLI